MVKDGENLRSSLKRNLRCADNLPTLWEKKGGVTVGGTGQELPSFPGQADVELQVVVLRSLYQALPEHFRRAKNAMDPNMSEWKTRIGLNDEGAAAGATRVAFHSRERIHLLAAFRTMVNAASAVWDGRRDGKEVQENAQNVGAGGGPPPVAAWVVPQAREGRANKRTKRQSILGGTFGLDIANTRAQMEVAGAAAA